jgi:ubiquinone/menaquinone biosynthesis C-methylase UbiE
MSITNFRTDPLKQLQHVRDIMFAFQKSRTLFTACELDIFTILGDELISAESVAKKINAEVRSTDRLLCALVALELVEKIGNEYRNSEIGAKHLSKNSPEYLGDLAHFSTLWDRWGDLTYAVKYDTPRDYQSLDEKSDDFVRAYAESAHWKATVEAPSTVAKFDLKGVNNVLDLGGGKGHYSVELLKRKPTLKCTVMDNPKIANLAHEYIDSLNLSDKINVKAGDLMSSDIGSGYDLVLISNVIHSYSIWDNVKLLQKVYEALNKKGIVVINEVIINDQRTSPQSSAIFSLNMLVNTLDGDSYTETDIWVMLRESWFRDIFRINSDYDTSLMIGFK